MTPKASRGDLLLEAGLTLASELSLPTVLRRIVEMAVAVTGARFGALGLLASDGSISDFEALGMTPEQWAAIGHLPAGRGVLGVVVEQARPLRLEAAGDHPSSVGFPPGHPPMGPFLGVPVTAYGRVSGNLYLTREPGAAGFDPEDEEALTVLAAQAGVAIENARLYRQAQQREQRLEAVREVATAILGGGEPEEVLDLVARRARELVGGYLASVVVPAEDPDSLVVAVAAGEHADQVRGKLLPRDRSMSGQIIASGEALILQDASKEGRAHQPIVQLTEVGPAMFVPLVRDGSAFGTLTVANRRGGRPFDPEDLALVQTFAAQAVMAIEYGHARGELQRLALLEDRERIAKELHDGVIQSLFAVGMGLQAAAAVSGDPDLQRRIEDSVAEMDRVIGDLRNYIFGLRPGILADRQLDQALHALAKDFQDKSGVLTVVDVDPRVAAELASRAGDVVQLVREALSNVGRHAGAATCRVVLVVDDGLALLEVDDDGTGFDVQRAMGRGLGLRNLRERATALGGELEIGSEGGRGTTVRVRLPL